MWNFLEGCGSFFTVLGLFGLLGSIAGGLEIGFGLVFLIFAGSSLVAVGLGVVLFDIGSKLHDKWLKETYPEAWKQNQAYKR